MAGESQESTITRGTIIHANSNKTALTDRLIQFLEKDTRAIQIVAYGVTSVGLLAALYRVRPFAKFTRPKDVPLQFIKLRVPLYGKVMQIEPNNGALILVDHSPLVKLPSISRPKYLPLKVAGVEVTNHGVSWLQTVVGNKKIQFIPMARKSDYLECTIDLQETEKTTMPIGQELVRLGFGTVTNFEPESTGESKEIQQQVCAYKDALTAAEKTAKLERNGYWHFNIHPTLTWKMRNYIHTTLTKTLPESLSKPLSI